MTARSPSAFMLSALMHGSVVTLVLLFAYVASDQSQQKTPIMELVAGEGNNYAALSAPALGNPGGIKVTVPSLPAPTPAPRVEPEPVPPAPVPAPAPEVSPVKVAPNEKPKAVSPVKPVDTVPNFKSSLKHTIIVADSKMKREIAKEHAAEAKAAKEQADKAKAAAAAKTAATKVARIDAEGIKSGVINGNADNKVGGAGGKALNREEMDEMLAYTSMLKTRLKENHEKPPGLSDTVAARVEFFLAADGTISRVKIIHSSGSAEFDRSVIDAFTKTKNLGPRPDHKSDMKELEFKMRDEDTG